MSPRNLLVGIGSPHGSDQLGWQVASHIQQRPPRDCDVRIALAPADILDWIQQYRAVHICDACCPGKACHPSVHRWLWPDAQIEQLAWRGTHDLSLPGVLHLASALGMAPPEIVLWGIEPPACLSTVDDTSAIKSLVLQAADRIRNELQQTAVRCTHA